MQQHQQQLNQHVGSKRDSNNTSSNGQEKIYEEMEYERRLKKRKMRLMTATDDAFAHIKRLNDQKSKSKSFPPFISLFRNRDSWKIFRLIASNWAEIIAAWKMVI